MDEVDRSIEDLNEVVAVARAAVEQEFLISERLDAKARGQATLAAQWFAVVQAVSAIAYSARGPNVDLLYFVGGAGVLGGIVLALTIGLSARVWRVKSEGAVSPQGLVQMKRDALGEGDQPLDLVTHYASILGDRRATNKERSDALEWAEWLWYAAMVIPFVQLGAAVLARLLV